MSNVINKIGIESMKRYHIPTFNQSMSGVIKTPYKSGTQKTMISTPNLDSSFRLAVKLPSSQINKDVSLDDSKVIKLFEPPKRIVQDENGNIKLAVGTGGSPINAKQLETDRLVIETKDGFLSTNPTKPTRPDITGKINLDGTLKQDIPQMNEEKRNISPVIVEKPQPKFNWVLWGGIAIVAFLIYKAWK